jgi:hypothetical protein
VQINGHIYVVKRAGVTFEFPEHAAESLPGADLVCLLPACQAAVRSQDGVEQVSHGVGPFGELLPVWPLRLAEGS